MKTIARKGMAIGCKVVTQINASLPVLHRYLQVCTGVLWLYYVAQNEATVSPAHAALTVVIRLARHLLGLHT